MRDGFCCLRPGDGWLAMPAAAAPRPAGGEFRGRRASRNIIRRLADCRKPGERFPGFGDPAGQELDFSRPGKPTGNGYIESFDGKFLAK